MSISFSKAFSIIVIILSFLLVFFFRWTIIDNIFFFLTHFTRYQISKTYTNRDFGFSAEYPKNLPTITIKNNTVSFSNAVPWISVSIWEKENSLWQFIRNRQQKGNSSLYQAAKWHIFYYPFLGSIGYSLNIVDNKLAICISSPTLAGAGGRGLACYLSNSNKIYSISTSYLPHLPKNYIELNKFLSGFKILDK